jgi:polyhydroxyalkanoate synthesis repressor PhaR
MPVIKRYPNRKLYNTDTGEYISLDDVALLFENPGDVMVYDHRSGNNLTTLVLAQVLVEQLKKEADILSARIVSRLFQSIVDKEAILSMISDRTWVSRGDIQKLSLRIQQLEEKVEKYYRSIESGDAKGIDT